MDKTLYREFIWHLRYSESLFDAMRNINVDEKFLNELALHIAQIEKISVNSLPQGGGAVHMSCLRRKILYVFAFRRISAKKCRVSEL